MHELSVCRKLVETVQEQAQRHGYQQVKTVWLELGVLTGIDSATLRHGFDEASRGTVAEGAALHIVELPAQIACQNCGRTSAVARAHDPCPHCDSEQVQLTGGTELRIKELEVE